MVMRALVVGLVGGLWSAVGLELTFELPDNQEQCFFEDIKKDTDATIEFQYDVDMQLTGPNGQVLYKDVRKQYDSFTWKTDVTGAYQVCFSNEFSTFSHKIVYMDWQIGDDKPLVPQMETHLSAMTMLESSAVAVHEKLKAVDDYQTHHRLREATGRKRAEELNERVLWWSLGQTAVIFLCGIGQVRPHSKPTIDFGKRRGGNGPRSSMSESFGGPSGKPLSSFSVASVSVKTPSGPI